MKPTATQDDLNKAYRKKSRDLHPDKARSKFINSYALTNKKKGKKPGVHVSKQPTKKEVDAHVKKVTQAYQRLTVVADILKGSSRERYDHFLKNGFPKWRGTGYYYARFRPGIGSVLVGLLVVMGGGMHYFALVMSWKRRQEFVHRYIRHARKTAWGDATGIQGIPGVDTPPPEVNQQADDTPDEMAPVNRRQKRMMDKENRKDKKAQAAKKARSSGISTPIEAELISGPQGAKRRIVAENGKVLVVDSAGNVFLEEETEEGQKHEFLLDVIHSFSIELNATLTVCSLTRSPNLPFMTHFSSSCPNSSTTNPLDAFSATNRLSRNHSSKAQTFRKMRQRCRRLPQSMRTGRLGSERRRRRPLGNTLELVHRSWHKSVRFGVLYLPKDVGYNVVMLGN